MRHIRVIVTETGASVEIDRIIHGSDKQSVDQLAREYLRQIIEATVRDHPRPRKCSEESGSDMDEALRQGYWWADLGSEEFTVRVLEPLHVEQLGPMIVEINVEGGLVSGAKMPPGVQVVVRDYDTDGADVDQIYQDRDGRTYVTTVWDDGHDEASSDSLETLCAHLHGEAFVVLTLNASNEPDSRFEAWAYQGPLDFNEAGPVRFGLGADPIAALNALSCQLAVRPKP